MNHFVVGWMVVLLGLFSALAGDLEIPSVVSGEPRPGQRVRQSMEMYQDTEIHHLLYLPIDWVKDGSYPVVVEYPGNRAKGHSGEVESCVIGYGLSGGKGVIWVSLPFVGADRKTHSLNWWGDVEATVDYCRQVVAEVCREFGGNRDQVYLAGFSRGAIACNFIGLHEDEIARLWRGFICHSHYDGVRRWGYEGDDRRSAQERLRRLGKRPQFISHEVSVAKTRAYLKGALPDGNVTFCAIPSADHSPAWVLSDSPERRKVREWFHGLSEPAH